MSSLRIRIGITGNMKEKLTAVASALRPALAVGVRDILNDAGNLTSLKVSGQILRVRTGHLRRSIGPPVIRDTASGVSGSLSVTAKYAPFHEFGTARGLPARPYFFPSVESIFKGPPSAKERLALILQNTLKKAS